MADYLTDEEQVERLKNWWSENGRSVVATLVLTVAGAAGWRWYDTQRVETLQAASETYEAYLEATGDARAELAANLAAEYGDTSYATFSLLHQAKETADANDLEGAVAVLGRIVEADGSRLLRDIARLRIARLLMEQGDADGALAVLAEVTSQGFRALVLELKGDIHRRNGERELAHEAYLSAFAEMREGEQRPVLEMKVNDTAPAAEVPAPEEKAPEEKAPAAEAAGAETPGANQ